MTELILHPRTAELVDQFISSPSQALLLVGSSGVGKGSVATKILSTLLEVDSDKLGVTVMYITPEKNSISIDKIREVHDFVRLKTIGKKSIRRAILMEYADLMTSEAQNAFLKILEEPPEDTLIVMTANHRRALLPTVLSRVQTIDVYPPNANDIKTFLAESYDSIKINQLYLLSGGMPGLLSALLSDNQDHELVKAVTDAKEILQKTQFHRLAFAEQFANDRKRATDVTMALIKMSEAALYQAAERSDTSKIKQWHSMLKASQSANEALNQSANTKLVLANLFLSI